jgi:hypothetical protein
VEPIVGAQFQGMSWAGSVCPRKGSELGNSSKPNHSKNKVHSRECAWFTSIFEISIFNLFKTAKKRLNTGRFQHAHVHWWYVRMSYRYLVTWSKSILSTIFHFDKRLW